MAGGYQKPSKPASVSGPGKLSRRTDGGPAQKLRDIPDAKYGENAGLPWPSAVRAAGATTITPRTIGAQRDAGS
jgi:hypothetical protein